MSARVRASPTGLELPSPDESFAASADPSSSVVDDIGNDPSFEVPRLRPGRSHKVANRLSRRCLSATLEAGQIVFVIPKAPSALQIGGMTKMTPIPLCIGKSGMTKTGFQGAAAPFSPLCAPSPGVACPPAPRRFVSMSLARQVLQRSVEALPEGVVLQGLCRGHDGGRRAGCGGQIEQREGGDLCCMIVRVGEPMTPMLPVASCR
jgi:hypothetical protein